LIGHFNRYIRGSDNISVPDKINLKIAQALKIIRKFKCRKSGIQQQTTVGDYKEAYENLQKAIKFEYRKSEIQQF